MNEQLARHITLAIVGIGSILLFCALWLLFTAFGLTGPYMIRNEFPIEYMILIALFVALGILIILGAFYKLPLHILSVIGVLCTAYAFISSFNFDSGSAVFSLLLLVPLLFYYSVRFVTRNKKPKANKK